MQSHTNATERAYDNNNINNLKIENYRQQNHPFALKTQKNVTKVMSSMPLHSAVMHTLAVYGPDASKTQLEKGFSLVTYVSLLHKVESNNEMILKDYKTTMTT